MLTPSRIASVVALVGIAASALLLGGGRGGGVAMLYCAYLIAALAIIVGACRGGLANFPFWVTLMAAYPVLTPLVVQDGLGYSWFSGHVLWLQDVEHIAPPLLVAAFSCLFLSFAISPGRFGQEAGAQYRVGYDEPWWVVLTSAGMLASAWITEPGRPLGLATYVELREQRISGVNFAAGAFLVFALCGLAILRNSGTHSGARSVRWRRWLVSGTLIVSVLWLLAHARRSETAGLLIVVLCLFADRIPKRQAILYGVVAIFVFSVLGYVRNLRDPDELAGMLTRDYLQLPGAPGNVTIGYVSAYWLKLQGLLAISPGETYLGHLLRFPPAFLGLKRPPLAYNYVDDQVSLIGGEFFLLEPLVNFGINGIIIYLVLFAWLTNASIRGLSRFWRGHGRMLGFLVGGVSGALLFRTVWYGLGAWIKGATIAWLLAVALIVVRGAVLRHTQIRRVRGASPGLEDMSVSGGLTS